MTAMALDPAGGGADPAAMARRHGAWYAPLVTLKGEETLDGSAMAAQVVLHRRGRCPVVVDVGGGYGTDVSSRLRENGIEPTAFNGAGASTAKAADGLRFYNARAEAWWTLREELNPDQQGGAVIALPDDPELLADLTAPTFEVRTSGILVEGKEDIRKRLGRSTNKGDAVVMCTGPANKAVRRQLDRRSPGDLPRKSVNPNRPRRRHGGGHRRGGSGLGSYPRNSGEGEMA